MPTSVLLVDDDPAFRALARRMLIAAGLGVVAEASTVADATAAARDLKPMPRSWTSGSQTATA